MQPGVSDYIIAGGEQGKARLNVLSDVLRQHTKALLRAHGVGSGTSFLDLGCGGGNVAAMVAEMVGGSGSVTAIDFDDSIVTLAKDDAAAAGIPNISFRTVSVYDIEYDGVFDVAYARFLLSHLNDPERVLRLMMRSVKPGGKVIVEDVQFSGHFCHPHSSAFEAYLQYYAAAAKSKGADAEIGPALFSLFRQAGMEQVGFDVVQPCFNTGPGKWMGYYTLDKIKPALVQQHIADPEAIENTLRELKAFTEDEHTIISLPRIFRVWGVRV